MNLNTSAYVNFNWRSRKLSIIFWKLFNKNSKVKLHQLNLNKIKFSIFLNQFSCKSRTRHFSHKFGSLKTLNISTCDKIEFSLPPTSFALFYYSSLVSEIRLNHVKVTFVVNFMYIVNLNLSLWHSFPLMTDDYDYSESLRRFLLLHELVLIFFLWKINCFNNFFKKSLF